jgi:hypothetical protein
VGKDSSLSASLPWVFIVLWVVNAIVGWLSPDVRWIIYPYVILPVLALISAIANCSRAKTVSIVIAAVLVVYSLASYWFTLKFFN